LVPFRAKARKDRYDMEELEALRALGYAGDEDELPEEDAEE
jgi:hypothetical protein